MKPKKLRLVLVILLGFACASGAETQAPPGTVSAIEVTGSSDPSLSRYLSIRVGEPYDPEAVRSSVLLLSAMDLFDEVSVEQENGPGDSIQLVFKVVETPRLGELQFVTRLSGNSPDLPLDSGLAKALRSAAGLRSATPLRSKALDDALGRMTAWLRSHAYPGAAVEIEELREDPARRRGSMRDLLVRVLEARQERLVSSRIEGWPARLPEPPSPARKGEALTNETKEGWENELLSVLRRNAYYRAQIKTDSVQGDLVFFVTPGPPYQLDLGSLNDKAKARARSRFAEEGLSQDAIEETISALELEYVKRGYRYVVVDFQETRAGDAATGAFVVRPGPVWVLASVEYRTNGVLASPPGAGALAAGGPWLDADIDAEKARVEAALIDQGYASAHVTIEESGDPPNGKVVFNSVPGVLTLVSAVKITGAPPPSNRSRNTAVELSTRPTVPFRNLDVARDRTALLTSLRDDGYVDALVEATADYSDDRTRVAVDFQVTPGPRVKVGQIVVVGLQDTKESVILRESRLKEGDFLSYQKLLDTQSSLSGTGLFTNVQIRELTTAPDERNLIIEVTEGVRTTIVPGLGFSETEKLRASVELTRLNISGRARSASLFLRGSIRGSRALLSLNEPYAFGRRQAVNTQLYVEDDRSRQAFDFHRVGFQPQTIFPLRSGNILVQYTFQKTTTSNVAQDCAEVNRALCDGKVSGPSLGFVHDTRNDAIDPRRGLLYSVETLVSLAGFGGDSFFKTSAFAARYEEVRAGLVIAGSARLGLSRAFGSSAELPLPERFFAGGSSLLRGFRTDEVGPGRFNPEGIFVPEGGNALVAAALEARIDVTPSWGLQLFAETGNVFSRVSRVRLGDLREVAGVGLSYRSPFGPLRLDWGFKLDRREGESLQQLHLGVGYAF